MFMLNPSKNAAKKAHIAQAEKVKKSIIYLIHECINKLKIDNNKLSLITSELPKKNHFLLKYTFFIMHFKTLCGTKIPFWLKSVYFRL